VLKILSILFFYICLIQQSLIHGTRSVHRPKELWMPRIEVDWVGESTKKNILIASHIESVQMLKKFDREFLLSRLLPEGKIEHRNNKEVTTDGSELDSLINKLLLEIDERVKEYTDFSILKNQDFNRKLRCGLIVLKFKKYPFVLKLFIERPESFVKPYTKGAQPYFFYFMGGGINRHLMGFTRIKNLETIRKQIKEDPVWSEIIDTPRKWFWLPKEPKYLELRAYNLNTIDEQIIQIPAIYGLVADLIISNKELTIRSKTSRELGIKLSRVVGNRIDPHMGNFMLEDSSLDSNGQKIEKIILIDTEHFPSLVGLKKPLEFDGYLSWYLQLIGKFTQEKFLRTKQYRKQFQINPPEEFLAL
jgi:hypothetical protein